MEIRNFQGKQIGEPELDENITVRDYMSKNIYTFEKGQSVLEVMESLVKNNISGGPVVDENHQLIGIISEGDCIKQISESRYYNQPVHDLSVENYMVSNVETISPDMNLFDLANKFLTMKIRRFPVCENGKLIGLISQKDILMAALNLIGQDWKQ